MELKYFIKRLIRNFFLIFAVLVISITLLRQIFLPNSYIKLKDIYIYMICSLAGDLPSLIIYSPKELSEKEMQLRAVIHFVVLEGVILILANAMGWVSGAISSIFLAIQIAVIYILVRFLVWMDDRKFAYRINEKLKEMKVKSSDELD